MTAKEFAQIALQDSETHGVDPVDIIIEMKAQLNSTLSEQERELREKLTAVTTLQIRLSKV